MAKALWRKFFIRALAVLVYSLLGSLMFMKIEGRDETNKASAQYLLQSLRDDFGVKLNFTEAQFQDFVERASDAMERKNEKDWTFVNSCEFVMTALTTIGYGDITPETPLGQGLTILYCLIGLPLTVLFLKTVGETINTAINKAILKFEKDVQRNVDPQNRKVKCFIITLLLAACLMLLTGLAETHLHGLTFLEGLYLWFITMSTIGFGDYIPAKNYNENYNSSSEQSGAADSFLRLAMLAVPTAIGLAIMAAIVDSFVRCYEDLKSIDCGRIWKIRSDSTVIPRSACSGRMGTKMSLRPRYSPEKHGLRRYSV